MEQIVFRNQFGMCPRCNGKMYTVVTNRQLFDITQAGVPTRELDFDVTYTNICAKCRYKLPMYKTMDGLRPKPLGRPIPDVKLETPNSIGMVEGEKL